MKIAFLTEMGFVGKIPVDHPNMRTEFAWMYALEADHYNIRNTQDVIGYDAVVVIFPKGEVTLNAAAVKLSAAPNPVSDLLAANLSVELKKDNDRVFFMQEGPHWWFNDYELADQINFYNMLAASDGILAHNTSDASYYRGMFPNKDVKVMPTLMIEHSILDITPQAEDKTIVGGNFARWYGGFESFMVAQEFQNEVWGQTSHATRPGEDQLIRHLPRVMWTEWMRQLSTFKYAVHLMPTVAAGTFSLNCAYFGIPCIGNKNVDTQAICHPNLSVNVNDVESARLLAAKLKEDEDFYKKCSNEAKANYKQHYNLDTWRAQVHLS